MKQYIQAAVTVLAVVNPAISGIMFMKIVSGMPPRKQVVQATRAVLTVSIILLAAAFLGRDILKAFDISMDAFQIVGGVIIAYLGFQMLSGTSQGVGQTSDRESSLGPLVMFAASPGTIATVITLSAVHTPQGLPLTALAAIGIVMVVLWAVMVTMIGASSHINLGGQQFVSRIMGLILIAMGLQFALEGYKAFMAGG
jgi:multiple antibiotic resistance protein